MASPLRDRILSAPDLPEELLDVPEWDCKVRIRGLNGRQRAKMLQGASDEGGVQIEVAYSDLLTKVCFDPESDELIFTAEDGEALLEHSGEVLERVALVALRLSGLLPESISEAEKRFLSQTGTPGRTTKNDSASN